MEIRSVLKTKFQIKNSTRERYRKKIREHGVLRCKSTNCGMIGESLI